MTLREHLANCYDERHTLRNVPAMANFIVALKLSPELVAEAKARRDAITDDILKRDYVSKVHKQLLDSALAQTEEAHAG